MFKFPNLYYLVWSLLPPPPPFYKWLAARPSSSHFATWPSVELSLTVLPMCVFYLNCINIIIYKSRFSTLIICQHPTDVRLQDYKNLITLRRGTAPAKNHFTFNTLNSNSNYQNAKLLSKKDIEWQFYFPMTRYGLKLLCGVWCV